MRLVLRPKREPDAELIAVAVSGLGAVVALIWLRWLQLPTPVGLLRRVAHVPCPLCGGTRSVSMMLVGDLYSAFVWNPLVAVSIVLAAGWLLYALCALLLRWPRLRITDVSTREARLLRVGCVIVLAANWAYVWWMGI